MDLVPTILEHTIIVGTREFASFALTPAEADALLAQGIARQSG